MIKTLNKLGLQENYLNLVKAMYEKPTMNVILRGERLKAFLLRSGAKQRCFHHFCSTECSSRSPGQSNKARKVN